MRVAIICAGLLLAGMMAPAAASAGKAYIGGQGALVVTERGKGDGGLDGIEFRYEKGFHGAATLGYDLGTAHPWIGVGRIELEVGLQRSDLDTINIGAGKLDASGKVQVESIMVNTFGEHRETYPWIPYIGGGLGAARVSLDNVSFPGGMPVDDDDVVFAWQVGAGIGLQAFQRMALDLGYRYFQAVDPKFGNDEGLHFTVRYRAHHVLLGVRFNF
jgi:opacity protein-like surface antigen